MNAHRQFRFGGLLTTEGGPPMLGIFLATSLLGSCTPSEKPLNGDSRFDGGASDALEDAGSSGPPELCDGSQTVRLRYGIAANGGSIAEGTTLMWANGVVYWLITGSCHYWVMTSATMEVREGTIDAAEAREIARNVHYGRFGEWAGRYRSNELVPHAGIVALGSTVDTILCNGRCDTGPQDLAASMEFAGALLEQLYERGSGVDSAFRIAVILRSYVPVPAGLTPIQWPLNIALDSVALDMRGRDPDSDSYRGALVTDKMDAALLRALRRRAYSSDEGGPLWGEVYDFFWIEGPERAYMLYYRDALPIEDAEGVIRMDFSGAAN